jgi:uncharacterized protein YqjF (DUF2071 family)
MRWSNVIMLHYEIPFEELRKNVPAQLPLESFEGKYYVSFFGFGMVVRPRLLPPIPFLSYFEELNFRTYLSIDGRPGVYFFTLEAEKKLSAWMSKIVTGLNYISSQIQAGNNFIRSFNRERDYSIDISFEAGKTIEIKSPFEKWLTERYCLFDVIAGKIFRYDIHHIEWPLQELKINRLDMHYRLGNFIAGADPLLAHYSKGVEVVGWGMKFSVPEK